MNISGRAPMEKQFQSPTLRDDKVRSFDVANRVEIRFQRVAIESIGANQQVLLDSFASSARRKLKNGKGPIDRQTLTQLHRWSRPAEQCV